AVIARHPHATLIVVGSGPEESALRDQAALIGVGNRITFAGSIPQADLPAYYRRAGLFVAPFVQAAGGDQEGLGLVTVEAIACGCPVLATALPAVLDVLDPVIDGDM